MSVSRRWTVIFGGALIAGLGLAPTAAADEGRSVTDPRTLARELSDSGLAQFRQGDYDGALAAFSRSYELVPEPALLFDMAQAYRKRGNCQAALEHYLQFSSAVDPQTAARAKVSVHIEEMRACSSARGATQDAPLGSTKNGPPSVPASPPAVAPQVRPPAELQSKGLVVPLSAPPVEGSSGRSLRGAGVVLGATGVVTLVAAIAATIRLGTIENRVSNAFVEGGPSTPALDQLISEGRTYESAARALYAIGAVALLTGAVLYYQGARQAARRTALQATVTGSTNRAYLSLAVTFF